MAVIWNLNNIAYKNIATVPYLKFGIFNSDPDSVMIPENHQD